MTDYHAAPSSSTCHVLGEGPLWVAQTQTVLWVDIEEGLVFEGRLNGDFIEQIATHQFAGTVGAVVATEGNQLLVAAQERLILLSAPPRVRANGPRVIPQRERRRLNDGAVDPAGRFLVGTLSLSNEQANEGLYRVEDDATITVIDDDLTLSNGLAWSADGEVLYSTDTGPGIIWARSYDIITGTTGPRREHLRIVDGFPDGICMDVRGYLWVAIWGAGQIRAYTPAGEHVDTVHIAAPHPSSVAFIGSGLDILLVTTASRDLRADDLMRYPDAGRLFTARVGTTGVPTTPLSSSYSTLFSS